MLSMVSNVAMAGTGTDSDPYTVAEALALQKAGNAPETEIAVKGIVSKTDTPSKKHGDQTFYMSDDGKNENTLEAYACLGINKDSIKDDNKVEVGDEVVVKGVLKEYKGTIELDKHCYLLSHTKATTFPACDNIAAFLELASGAKVNLTLKDAIVVYAWTSTNGNTTAYIRDATGALDFYKTTLGFKSNDLVNGTVIVTNTVYNKLIEATENDNTNSDNLTITASSTPAEAKWIEINDAKDYVSDLVLINKVDVKKATNGTKEFFYAYNASGDSIQIYDGVHPEGLTLKEASQVAIKGIVARYKNTYEIYPVENFETTTAHVTSLPTVLPSPDDRIYNLAGQRVSPSYKGIVIKGGKKILQK